MSEPSVEQIRNFRLRAHHLDREYQKADIKELVGACGIQNTPPGAWETALYNRAPGCSQKELEQLLYKEKSLIQAWSLRGAPYIFPVDESDVFLSALKAEEGEPWIYTSGILLALDYLQMAFDELLDILRQVMPRLDATVIVSKSTLDQTLAEWMIPLLPTGKRELWNHPSMYGSPDKQTVGGAVVSFLLRPCSFEGLTVFGERDGISPTFTSYKGLTGHPMYAGMDASNRLIRKYLHCYGPATVDRLTGWLGCSGIQGRRMWKTIAREIEPVKVQGKTAYILSEDADKLFAKEGLKRELLLLGGHDPYLDQRDRIVLQPDKALHRQIWKTVLNPGVVSYRGELVGVWSARKKGNDMEIRINLWKDWGMKQELCRLAEEYAAFRQKNLMTVEVI